MDFQLQTLTRHQAASMDADALVVLWPDAADDADVAQVDVLSAWARQALANGDLAHEPDQWLAAHRLPGVRPRRVVLVRCGDGSARRVRQAVAAAWGAIKAGAPVRSLLLHAGGLSLAALQAAV